MMMIWMASSESVCTQACVSFPYLICDLYCADNNGYNPIIPVLLQMNFEFCLPSSYLDTLKCGPKCS